MESEPSEQAETISSSSGGNNALAIRSKPCREIYRPPNLRKGGSQASPTKHKSSPSKTSHDSRHENETGSAEKPKFNINAKEFCYQPKVTRPLASHVQYDSTNTFQTVEQQLRAYREEDYMLRNSVAGITQSKSVGNMTQAQELVPYRYNGPDAHDVAQMATMASVISKPIPEGPRPTGILTSTFLKNNAKLLLRNDSCDDELNHNASSTSRLKQSKSSGNVPSGLREQHKVRFQDDEDNDDDEDSDLMGNCLTSLKLKEGEEASAQSPQNLMSPSRKPVNFAQLQRSRTMSSYMPWSENGGTAGSSMGEPLIKHLPLAAASNYFSQTNPWLHYIQRLQQEQLQRRGVGTSTLGTATAMPLGQFFTASVAVSQNHPNSNIGSSAVKRSKSFHSASAAPSLSARSGASATCFPPLCPSILDFHIARWPKNVQEAITTVVTGVERNVTARHKIEMVAQIFEALFDCKRDSSSANSRELIVPAVHVFMYLLIKEKHNLTIAESLMNTCCETFQVLVQKCKEVTRGASASSQARSLISTWVNFLKFLSTIYSQIKANRLQQLPPGNNKRTINEMNSRILALTCDVCHATLSSHILLMTSETTDHLFMSMTSIGRDMETAYPMKMKQILAAVRDVLLGVGSFPIDNQNSIRSNKSLPAEQNQNKLSPCIQKTLMQLIELHAANWNLPASAVRYYYNSNDTK